jgi:hypothetical protein
MEAVLGMLYCFFGLRRDLVSPWLVAPWALVSSKAGDASPLRAKGNAGTKGMSKLQEYSEVKYLGQVCLLF